MKWLFIFIGLFVLVAMTLPDTGTTPAAYKPPPRGLVISQEAALKYIKLMIVANGHRCQRIDSAHMWAAEDGGSYTQVGCNIRAGGEGLWYGVHTNDKGKFTSIDAPRTTAIFPQ